MVTRVRLTITGVVQGVGFRPHVYRLAIAAGLKGYVLNNAMGVVIEAEGVAAGSFAENLTNDPPPLSSIKNIVTESLPPAGYTGFEIRISEDLKGEFALVSPDIATCPDCIADMCRPSDRRYLYPFTNCTNCGPRYSIIKGVPYDRPKTTMSGFTMCADCSSEYHDPADRRFHAQPVACPSCGPKVEFAGPDGERAGVFAGEAIARAVDALKAGLVVAVKGLGGFHLACDATNRDAVRVLRERKRKCNKPFALMAPDVETVRRYCVVSGQEEALLTGRVRPVVLLARKYGAEAQLPDDVAPGVVTIGFMLPYTPLHHLLFNPHGLEGWRAFDALVMTSGNIAEEPIVTDNEEALTRLSGMADAFLLHDRDIFMRVDDSIVRVYGGLPRVLRRARGYAPEAIDLGREMPDVLGCGGELKNTLCLTRGGHAIMSQHIGELTGLETMRFYSETLANLKGTFRAEPHVVAHDMHPDYMSTAFAKQYVADGGGPVVLAAVQHHHAHIAACMAENGHSGRVIGVALDGTGYGTDGNIWGSEFLLADYGRAERFAHMGYVPLPGGDQAVRQPWRTALSFLINAYGQTEGMDVFGRLFAGRVTDGDAAVVARMVERGINSPLSCGMGRLFDALSSIAGVCDAITYEGEAAVLFEALAHGFPDEQGIYPYRLVGSGPVVVDTAPLIRAAVSDIAGGVPAGAVAARSHNTLTDMITQVCGLAREASGLSTVALSGGVFQNALLFEKAVSGLAGMGFIVLSHSRLPANDGCVSLGQAVIAAFGAGEKAT